MTFKSNLKVEFLKHPLDTFWQATIIKILPRIITPNLLSLTRIALIPAVLVFILYGLYLNGLILFIIVALTDSLDGALARHRNQITELGLILDPLADKLLIIGTLAVFLKYYPFPELILYLMAFELIILFVGYIQVKISNQLATPSNLLGKIKMVCQSLSVIVIFLWLILPSAFLLYLSAYLLLFALLFLILSTIFALNIIGAVVKNIKKTAPAKPAR